MKILFITPHLSTGGLPQYLLRTIQILSPVHNVYLIEYHDCTGGKLVVQRNQLVSLLKDRFFSLGEDKRLILSLISKISPDVIHLAEIPELFLNYKIAELIYNNKTPIIETSHDSSFNIKDKRFLPDKFVLVSEFQRQLFESLGVPIEIADYPIEFKERLDRDSTLKFLGLDPSIFHILNIGLFTLRKNQAEIIEYAKQLLNYNVQFHFIGNQADNFKSYWEPLMKDLPSNCKIWGERIDTGTFYSSMDLFLFTSKGTQTDKETMPLVLKEAVSWRIPVLAYNLPVYLGYFDKFNIEYLDEFSNNLERIKKKLILKPDFEITYSKEKDTIYIAYKGSNSELKCGVSLKDSGNGLNNFYNEFLFTPNSCFWIKSNSQTININGWTVEIYKRNQLIYSKEIVNFGNNSEIKIDNNKIKPFHNFNDNSAWWSFHEIFQEQVYPEVEGKDIDIGANIGLFTLFCLSKECTVYSIEPNPENFNFLVKNTGFSDRVNLFNLAISGGEQEISMFKGNSSATHSYFKNENIKTNNFFKCPAQTLEEFCKKQNVDFDYLKIDCEGMEFEIFKNINELFLRNFKKIALEVHGFAGSHYDYDSLIKNKLIRAGFEVIESGNLDLKRVINVFANKRPNIKIVHLLNEINSNREQQSINSINNFSNEFGYNYIQEISSLFNTVPPKESCRRPNDISDKPDPMKLTNRHYGCYLAHKTGVLNHLDSDAILICECDCLILNNLEFHSILQGAFKHLSTNDFLLCSFGKQIKNHPHKQLNEDFYIVDQVVEIHCILIHKRMFEYLKNKFETTSWDVADLWYNSQCISFPRIITSRPYSLQVPSISNITENFKNGFEIEIPNTYFNEFDYKNDIAIIIQTCDDYNFLWRGLYLFFSRYWCWDIDWKIYICTEELDFPYIDSRIINLKSSKLGVNGFSTRLNQVLNNIPESYILYLQDDMWLFPSVDSFYFKYSYFLLKHFEWNGVKIHSKYFYNYKLTPTNKFVKKKRLFKQTGDSEYLLSHQATIWNKGFLLSIMSTNETPWDNEKNGTERIRKLEDPRIYHLNYQWYFQHNKSSPIENGKKKLLPAQEDLLHQLEYYDI